jgi:Protein of unknown function (DUF2934)
MDTLEDRIRRRAYELWEQAGRTGDPEDHWLRAEREMSENPDDTEATTENANPGATAAAEEAVTASPRAEAPRERSAAQEGNAGAAARRTDQERRRADRSGSA